ncbi:MAG: hypothetical protein KAR42_01905 [candidate division Zixibacteria bacterium]|nr:hypothetical protein [candidate division Zixibacteria bacterium]
MIVFRLDTEDEIDIVNLIGDISITDGKTSIHFQYGYVDSILETLLTGVVELKGKCNSSVELIEEPGSFDFEVIGEGIKLTYLKNELLIDKSSLIKNLKLTIDKLLSEIRELQGTKTTPIIDSLRRLVEQL